MAAIDWAADEKPTPDAVLAARLAAGLTQTEAAQSVGLGHYRRWGEYEAGIGHMTAERYELFLLRHGLHPRFELTPRS